MAGRANVHAWLRRLPELASTTRGTELASSYKRDAPLLDFRRLLYWPGKRRGERRGERWAIDAVARTMTKVERRRRTAAGLGGAYALHFCAYPYTLQFFCGRSNLNH